MKQHLQFCVYKITNSISGKSYIGKTKDLTRRWKEHLKGSKNINVNNKFPNALKKYPEYTWDVSILYETDDEDYSYEVEALLVDEYDTFKSGYNSCGGGIGGGSGENSPMHGKTWKWTQEQRDARSGVNNPMFGKQWSQERKDIVSGKNSPLFGKTWSQERKDTISGTNSANFGSMPWETAPCKSKGLQINWFYLDKVYDLRIKYGYGPKRIHDLLFQNYPNIKNSKSSFQNMFKWIEKHGNPIENKEWLEFKYNYNFI